VPAWWQQDQVDLVARVGKKLWYRQKIVFVLIGLAKNFCESLTEIMSAPASETKGGPVNAARTSFSTLVHRWRKTGHRSVFG
jgi:hypothetical protein